jgi:hypothetical protein
MTEIEATGAPAACARCGRTAPAGSHPDWGGLMLNGRLVQLACPDCLTDVEREEIGARAGASMWEVVPGRRAAVGELVRLARAARERGGRAPEDAWLAGLEGTEPAVGVVVGEPDGAELRSLWVATGRDGRPRAAELDARQADWLSLEEVLLPPQVRELALRVAGSRG